MAPKKQSDPTSRVGKPQSAYDTSRTGDEWFSDEQNTMDDRKTSNTPTGKDAGQAGRARKMQQDDLNKSQQEGVAGATPSYKNGGKVRRTGLAKLHKGERVIPRHKVKAVDRLIKRELLRGSEGRRGKTGRTGR